MTLYELWLVIKRNWKLMVALPVVCAVACGAWLLATKGEASYTAKAQVVANSQVAYVAGAAKAEADARYGDEDSEMTVSAKADSATMTVTVTATGPDAGECVEAANAVARVASEAASEAFEGFENPYSGTVVEALEAEEVPASSGGAKYLLVAVLAGLFLAVCIAIALDMRRRPVKTPEGAQEATELPVLEVLPAESGERLLANVRFAADEGPLESVLVVPAGDASAAQEAASLLEAAARAEGAELEVTAGEPLSESMAAAYASREAGTVVVAARQWADSLPSLESTAAELRLAGAALAGLVLVEE